MPVTNFSPNKVAKGPGLIWYNVEVPAAGARLVIDTAGVPSGTGNTSAKHIGYTASGATFTVSKTVERFFADEEANPISQAITESIATITADIMLVDDFDVLELVTRGVGTRVTAAGIESITGGISGFNGTSMAVIFPTTASTAAAPKYGVFHLYNAVNEGGFDVALSRKSLSQSGVTFTGLAVSGRAVTDTSWNRWSQI